MEKSEANLLEIGFGFRGNARMSESNNQKALRNHHKFFQDTDNDFKRKQLQDRKRKRKRKKMGNGKWYCRDQTSVLRDCYSYISEGNLIALERVSSGSRTKKKKRKKKREEKRR
jgi:hypothetical protein